MKRVLAIDLGKARTGLAISDELGMLAQPLQTIEKLSDDALAKTIRQIVSEKNVDGIIVGLPKNMNGTLGAAANDAEKFAAKLRALVPCPVEMWDERLSTIEANRALQAAGKKTRETRGIRDQVAAQIILQSYLDRLNG